MDITTVYAADQPVTLASQAVFGRINYYIISPFIYFLFALALLYFLWGLVRYMYSLSEGEKGTGLEEGKKHMIWGIVGMAIMISAFGIMQFIWATVTNENTAPGISGTTPPQPSEINGLPSSQ